MAIKAKDTLPAGNFDGISIVQTFESHGMQVETSSRNYRPDILNSLKEQRNNLAHGSVSFVEAVRTDGLRDISENKEFVFGFLDELIRIYKEYIAQQAYRA